MPLQRMAVSRVVSVARGTDSARAQRLERGRPLKPAESEVRADGGVCSLATRGSVTCGDAL